MTENDGSREQTVCFTGHREIRRSDVAERLDALIAGLYLKGYRIYLAGGALGFDTEAALAVLRAREKHLRIELRLVLPFPGQSANWSGEQRAVYEDIKRKAASVTYTSLKYTRGCYHTRNRALVDGAGLCVAYLVKRSGGTAYTVDYARRQGLAVINVAQLQGGE